MRTPLCDVLDIDVPVIRPFAINHTPRPFDEAVRGHPRRPAARPAAISYHLGDPGELVGRAHDAGCLWIQQVMDVDHALDAVRRGVDVIVAQGGEAGGHSGFVGTMALVPQIVDVAGDICGHRRSAGWSPR